MARRDVQSIFGNVGAGDKNLSRQQINHATPQQAQPNPYVNAATDIGKTYAMKGISKGASSIFGGAGAAGASGVGGGVGALASTGGSAGVAGGSMGASAGLAASQTAAGGSVAAGAGGAGASGGLAAAGPIGWIAAAAIANETYAKNKGYRAENSKEYTKDLFTSEVFNQDLEKRWLPKIGIKEGSTANKVISHISNPFGWFASKI